MAKKKKRRARRATPRCRQVTFTKNKKGRRITPKTVTLCPRSAKAKRSRIGRQVAKQACRRADKGDKGPNKHLFTRCEAR